MRLRDIRKEYARDAVRIWVAPLDKAKYRLEWEPSSVGIYVREETSSVLEFLYYCHEGDEWEIIE